MAGKDFLQGWGLRKIYSHKKANIKVAEKRKREDWEHEEMMIEGENRKKSKFLKNV